MKSVSLLMGSRRLKFIGTMLILLALLSLFVTQVHLAKLDRELRKFQGVWTVVGGEHNAENMTSLNGGTLIVQGRSFRIDSAEGNKYAGVLRMRTPGRLGKVDFMHQMGLLSGQTWLAIYEVRGNHLHLCYAEPWDSRPQGFTTTEEVEDSMITLVRSSR